jgi:hypothetical protein
MPHTCAAATTPKRGGMWDANLPAITGRSGRTRHRPTSTVGPPNLQTVERYIVRQVARGQQSETVAALRGRFFRGPSQGSATIRPLGSGPVGTVVQDVLSLLIYFLVASILVF